MKQRLHRLLRLTPREVRERAGQGVAKWAERRLGRQRAWPHFEAGQLARVPAGSPFPGSLADTMKALDTHAPGARARLVASAEACLAGRFDLLGYEGLSFGHPVDWHLDPVSGHRGAPRALEPDRPARRRGRRGQQGDLGAEPAPVAGPCGAGVRADTVTNATRRRVSGTSKRGSTRTHQASVSTGRAVSRSLSGSISWCWTLSACAGSQALGPCSGVEVLSAIWLHAAHVERYLSYYFSPNTHLTGEALGLLLRRRSRWKAFLDGRWRELGRGFSIVESQPQVRPTASTSSNRTCYHRYTIDIYLHSCCSRK